MRTGTFQMWSPSPGFLDPSAKPGGEILDKAVLIVVVEGHARVAPGVELKPGDYVIYDPGDRDTFEPLTPVRYLQFDTFHGSTDPL